MKERGILFNSEMVNATLENRKFQTRRVLKVQPKTNNPKYTLFQLQSTTASSKNVGKFQWGTMENEYTIQQTDGNFFKCPYGKIGDHLYVREKHKFIGFDPNDFQIKVQYSDLSFDWIDLPEDFDIDNFDCLWEQLADDYKKAGVKIHKPTNLYIFSENTTNYPTPWRPSIFMHRWASRITLEITDIRVERVQGISEEEAIKEGIDYNDNIERWIGYTDKKGNTYHASDPCPAFKLLFNSINEKRGFGWSVNPWVWVIEFKKIKE